MAPARVALLVHYFQRPTNELPVPIARAREAAPLPQRLPLLLREQSVLLQEGMEHLVGVVMRITQPGERHDVRAAYKPRHGPRGDVSHRRPGAGRRVEYAPLAFHRREIRCSKSLIRLAVEEDRRKGEDARAPSAPWHKAVVLLLRLVEDPELPRRRRRTRRRRATAARPSRPCPQRAPPGAARLDARCLILSRRSSRRSRSAIFSTATSWRSSGAYINWRSPKVDLCASRSLTFSQPAVKKLLSKAASSGRGVAAAGVAHCRGASTASATSSEAAAAMLAMRRDVLGGPNGSLRCVLPRMGQPHGS